VSRQRFHQRATPPASGSITSTRSPCAARSVSRASNGSRAVSNRGLVGRATFRKRGRRDVSLLRRRRQAEAAIGLGSFADRPRMDVETDDARRRRHRRGPRGACRAGATSEIDQCRHTVEGRRQHANDVRDEQMVKRSIKKGECCALAAARQRRALDQPVAALDVSGRQRAQRARHFPKRQLAEMFRFERGEPGDERVG
jgi:hypothetical protein